MRSRTLLLALVAMLAIALSGCGTGDSEPTREELNSDLELARKTIIGEWTDSNEEASLIFNDDGTGLLKLEGMEQPLEYSVEKVDGIILLVNEADGYKDSAPLIYFDADTIAVYEDEPIEDASDIAEIDIEDVSEDSLAYRVK